MRVLIFGASGGCGSELVAQSVERGWSVTAVVRPESRDRVPEGVAVAAGDVLSAAFVRDVVPGHDIVFSGLGLRRAALFPWARLLSPPDLVQRFTAHLRQAIEGAPEVRRVVWISAGGVADSRSAASLPIRAMIDGGNVGVAYVDLAAAERASPREDPRWLAVRPVTLVNGPSTGRAGPVARYGLFSIIRRADVAAWMLDVAGGTVAWNEPAVLLGTN